VAHRRVRLTHAELPIWAVDEAAATEQSACVPEALIDVVARLRTIAPGDRFGPGPTIFARLPIAPESNAVVLAEEVVGGVAQSDSTLAYVLEVAIAQQVLDVWSLWRDGRLPSRAEAVDAVIYFALNDAYQPIE
jgi:hypothetical protein